MTCKVGIGPHYPRLLELGGILDTFGVDGDFGGGALKASAETSTGQIVQFFQSDELDTTLESTEVEPCLVVEGMASLVVEEVVTEIGAFAFEHATVATSIELKEGLEEVGLKGLYDWPAMATGLTLPSTLSAVGIEGFSAWSSYDDSQLIIPAGISLENGAFLGWLAFSGTLKFGDSSISTSLNSFGNWSSLTEIEFLEDALPSSFHADTFQGSSSGINATVVVTTYDLQAWKTALEDMVEITSINGVPVGDIGGVLIFTAPPYSGTPTVPVSSDPNWERSTAGGGMLFYGTHAIIDDLGPGGVNVWNTVTEGILSKAIVDVSLVSAGANGMRANPLFVDQDNTVHAYWAYGSIGVSANINAVVQGSFSATIAGNLIGDRLVVEAVVSGADVTITCTAYRAGGALVGSISDTIIGAINPAIQHSTGVTVFYEKQQVNLVEMYA